MTASDFVDPGFTFAMFSVSRTAKEATLGEAVSPDASKLVAKERSASSKPGFVDEVSRKSEVKIPSCSMREQGPSRVKIECVERFVEDDLLYGLLDTAGAYYVDHRCRGGALWIAYDEFGQIAVDELSKLGMTFTYTSKGGSALKGRAGWWTKSTGFSLDDDEKPETMCLDLEAQDVADGGVSADEVFLGSCEELAGGASLASDNLFSDGCNAFSPVDVVCIGASYEGSNVYLLSGEVLKSPWAIFQYEELFADAGFIRAGRAHLVNSAHIIEVVNKGKKNVRLRMRSLPQLIPTSAEIADHLL